MTVAPGAFGAHPVVACAARVVQELGGVAAVPVELMPVADKAEALVAVSAAAARLEALRLRLLAAADDVAAGAGARDAAAWLAHEVRADRHEQQRDLRLATAFTERWCRVATGVVRG